MRLLFVLFLWIVAICLTPTAGKANCSQAILLLDETQVAQQAPPLPEIIDLMRQMFQWKAEGRITMIPKPILHPSSNSDTYATALMSAIFPPNNPAYVGMKFSMGVPENPPKGLPYIQSEIILRDFETGRTLAIMDGNWITGVRTGAISAVAAELLSEPSSQELAIVSAGRQARTNLDAILSVRAIRHVKIYDPHTPSVDSFMRWASIHHPQLTITVEGDLKKLVETADILITAAPIQKTPLRPIQRHWVKPSAFIVSLDFDSSLAAEFVDWGQFVVTDDYQQIVTKKNEGYFDGYERLYKNRVLSPIDAELADLHAYEAPEIDFARTQRVFLNLGISPSDLVLANAIYLKALKNLID